MIQFQEDIHQYKLKNKVYISATQLIHKYSPPFDTEYWSLYCALKEVFGKRDQFKNLKSVAGGWKRVIPYWKDREMIPFNPKEWPVCYRPEVEQVQSRLKDEWKTTNRIALDKGSAIHKFLEYLVNEMQGYMRRGRIIPLSNEHPMLKVHRGHHVFPELRLWNLEYMVAGSADLIEINNNEVFIFDYKTNAEIDMINTFGTKMLHPLEELDDCDFSYYTLQLSLYMWMLEECGYKATDNMALYHVVWKDDHSPVASTLPFEIKKRITVPYRKDLILKMLKHHEENRN